MKNELHLVHRQFWSKRLEEAWKHRSVLWLSGVRRAGKATLCQAIPQIEYFDCELPRTRRLMEDPQAFLDSVKNKKIVLDEIHRLDNPSELLKIAADHYPKTQVIATGSSTLGASARFRDTLTGRKSELWLTPMISTDLEDFQVKSLRHRLLYGGLPSFCQSEVLPEKDFQEWMDSYWARDIQELFRLERRHSFLKFAELLMAQSGGIFEASRFSRPCEVSRTTISNYLRVLETTFVVHVITPYSTHRPTEIISAPKVYAFDTGFVCYYRGWHDLRNDDLGLLWEHFVLNELFAHLQSREIQYWRDKRGHEVDFIWAPRNRLPLAIECKWSGSEVDLSNLQAFRKAHPKGENFVVAQDVDRSLERRYNNLTVTVCNLESLIKILTS